PSLLLDPLERRVEPLGGAAGPGDAAQLHLVDALPNDGHRYRGGEAPLKLERCRVRRMRCDAHSGDDIVNQSDGHGDERGKASVLTGRRVDAVRVGEIIAYRRSGTGGTALR